MHYAHLAARIFDTPLLVAPHKLRTILEVLAPKLGIEGMEGLDALPKGGEQLLLPSQAARWGDDEDEDEARARPYTMLDGGVAVIPILGTLVHRGGWLDAMSGLTSYQRLQNQVVEAMEDREVSRVVFDIDSPGGEASGVFDLADMIASYRGAKPMTAVVNEAAYSAAYALASAADRIIVPRTAGVGSVGVIATHMDQSKKDDKEGYTITHVTAGARKADFSPHRPLSDEALGWLQEHVEETYSLFVDTVARNRGLDAQAVRQQEAGIFVGRLGLSYGLADEVAPATEAIQREVNEATQRRTVVMTKQTQTAPQVGQDKPDNQASTSTQPEGVTENLAAEIVAAAKQSGVELDASALGSNPADAVQALVAAATEKGAEKAEAAVMQRAKAIKGLARQANRPAAALDLFLEGLSEPEARERLFADLASQERVDGGLTPDSALGGSQQPVIDTHAIYQNRRKAG